MKSTIKIVLLFINLGFSIFLVFFTYKTIQIRFVIEGEYNLFKPEFIVIYSVILTSLFCSFFHLKTMRLYAENVFRKELDDQLIQKTKEKTSFIIFSLLYFINLIFGVFWFVGACALIVITKIYFPSNGWERHLIVLIALVIGFLFIIESWWARRLFK